MLAAALLGSGCTAERIIPVLVPIPSEHVKPGGRNQALVVLPNNAVASVYIHFVYRGGRIAIVRIGVVNHNPDRITLYPTQTRMYVDEGPALQIVMYKDFDTKESNVDFHILRDLPKESAGVWLIVRPRYLKTAEFRGPTVVLSYSVQGYEGFVKVEYRTLWNMSEGIE